MSLACKCVPTKCGDLPALPVCFFWFIQYSLSLSLSQARRRVKIIID
jgi:hypothetical protein